MSPPYNRGRKKITTPGLRGNTQHTTQYHKGNTEYITQREKPQHIKTCHKGKLTHNILHAPQVIFVTLHIPKPTQEEMHKIEHHAI